VAFSSAVTARNATGWGMSFKTSRKALQYIWCGLSGWHSIKIYMPSTFKNATFSSEYSELVSNKINDACFDAMIKFRNSLNFKTPYLWYPTACCKFDSCGSHSTVAGHVTRVYFYAPAIRRMVEGH